MVEQGRLHKNNLEAQDHKYPNTQKAFNKSVQNEDALFKSMAYSAMVDQKYKTQMENPDHVTFKDKEYMTSPYTFERYYINQLEKEALRPARAINPEDYEPKKFMRAASAKEPQFLTRKEAGQQFLEDHSKFMENKKEQVDRTKLYYILEQFYEHSREQQDKTSDAQRHMQDYFSDPENTYFFDKNKM